MRLPSWSVLGRGHTGEDDALADELRANADRLSPDEETLARVRSRARDRFETASSRWIHPSREVGALGVSLGLALMGVAALAAIFGVYGVLAGLSVFGFGQFVAAAPVYLGASFTLVGFLILTVSGLELLFACGIWARRPWAWKLGVFVETLLLLLSVVWILPGAL